MTPYPAGCGRAGRTAEPAPRTWAAPRPEPTLCAAGGRSRSPRSWNSCSDESCGRAAEPPVRSNAPPGPNDAALCGRVVAAKQKPIVAPFCGPKQLSHPRCEASVIRGSRLRIKGILWGGGRASPRGPVPAFTRYFCLGLVLPGGEMWIRERTSDRKLPNPTAFMPTPPLPLLLLLCACTRMCVRVCVWECVCAHEPRRSERFVRRWARHLVQWAEEQSFGFYGSPRGAPPPAGLVREETRVTCKAARVLQGFICKRGKSKAGYSEWAAGDWVIRKDTGDREEEKEDALAFGLQQSFIMRVTCKVRKCKTWTLLFP